jgi:thioredoxin reductase
VKLEGESEMRLDVDGVFIILEHVPTTSILSDAGIESDEGGCIVVDRHQQTNIPGIFAAGDCTCSGTQIVTAAGDGGRAALSALRYVRSLEE